MSFSIFANFFKTINYKVYSKIVLRIFDVLILVSGFGYFQEMTKMIKKVRLFK